jgi:hypothetical protein
LMEGSMPPEGRRYCAKVCVVWIVFFALNATLAFDSVFRSLEWWGLYNGCISYCCIAFLVLAELLVRRRVKSRARKQVSLACLLVLVCSVPLPNAHGGLYAEPQAVSDTTARLERIRSRLAPPGPFVADFTEKRFIAVLTEPLESRGIMRCIPGQGLVWETQSPVQRSSTITQQGITEVHGSSAVTTATDSTRVSQVLLSLLSGSVDNSSDYFDLYVSGNETQWEIRLVPRDDLVRQVISIVSIRGSLRPQQLEVAHASGDRVVTSFSEPRLLTKHEIEQAQEALKRAS